MKMSTKGKSILVSGVVFIAAFLSVQGWCSELKRFPVKSGQIEYALSGATTGKKVIYFDNYGALYYELIQETTSVKLGQQTHETKSHKLTLRNPEYIYDLDLDAKTGTRISTRAMDSITGGFTQGMTQEQAEQMGKDLLKQMGGSIVGKDKILGKECEVVELMGTRSCLYKKSLVLRSEATLLGMQNTEIATLYKENIKIAAAQFEPPKGILVEEQDVKGLLGMGADDEDVDAEDWREIAQMKLQYSEFEAAMSNIKVKGYNKVRGESEPGEYYAAIFMTATGETLYIDASPLANFSSYSGEEGLEITEQFKVGGEAAAFGKFEEGDTQGTVLFVEFPRQEVMVKVVSSTAMTKQALVNIIEQIKF